MDELFDIMLNEFDFKKAALASLASIALNTGTTIANDYNHIPSQSVVGKSSQDVQRSKGKATTTLIVNINKIAQIESSNNPKAVNKRSGARGICQIMETTWKEMTKKMGVNWSWDSDVFDEKKNKDLANYYYNKEIPRLLKHYRIPDTIEVRLASYNWGIGNVYKVHKKYGTDWIKHIPTETQTYIRKYKS